MEHNLQVGDTSPRVAEARNLLIRLGLLRGTLPEGSTAQWSQARGDDKFDLSLEVALKAFQQQRGVLADGKINEHTLRMLREATYQLGVRVLQYDVTNTMQGEDVSELQAHLQDLGFYTGHVDGNFGPETYAAVKNYQRDYALRVDGIVGPVTVKALSYLGRRIRGGSRAAIQERETVRAAGPQLTGKRIVIDPGLGGAERGHIVAGPYGELSEEEILWDIATRLEGRMVAAGIETIISRPRQANPTDVERASIANAFGADVMISLRCDWYHTDKASGCASFYFGSSMGNSSITGELLSGYIQREIAARTNLQNCWNHARTWEMLRLTSMPTVETVLGYLSNPGDAAILADPSQRDVITEAILIAVKRLYLADNDNAPTGTFTFSDLLKLERQ
ncbi:MAG: peptidoglycan-binding protein [Bifidobacterium sp.]|nr:peptidoglycan-binding protein [Bifidobacterium sp.]